ncbi:MAG: MATE family efflux transporter [Deltaproteobacteria bacterium]|nr:MATE family efflux transporter [Deltaproteobacteria bacterium]
MADLNPFKHWNSPQGYKEFLTLCLPLIASTTASSLMLFTDRLFLSNYSVNAIAASLPAGVMKVTISAVFLGIVSYTGVFVAQYTGADKPERASGALWQGLYFSLVSGAAMAFLFFASPFIFSFGSSNQQIIDLEIQYFGPLIVCSPLDLVMVAMSVFMAALGRTKVVMWVSLGGAILNIPLDYFFIYGLKIGSGVLLPEMGIFGASLATVVSWALTVVVFSVLIFNKKMEASHRTISNRSFDWPLMKRMFKYGWPGGLQFFMEIFTFSFFAFAVARLDDLTLACNNIVFSLEALSFFPMIGVGQTVSIMVGHSIGRSRPDEGSKAAKTGAVVSSFYVLLIVSTFLLFPNQLLSLFLDDGLDLSSKTYILSLGTTILRFVAVYSLFDGLYLCCFGAIRGAGDVWFPLASMAAWGILGLMAPILIFFYFNMATIYTMWIVMVIYILGLTTTGVLRFLGKKWMKMRVIEPVLTSD